MNQNEISKDKIIELWENVAININTLLHCPICNTTSSINYEDYFIQLLIDNLFAIKKKNNNNEKISGYLQINCFCPVCHKHHLYMASIKNITIPDSYKYTNNITPYTLPQKTFDIRFDEFEYIHRLIPEDKSIAKTFPDYIPPQLINLYEEMCELLPININASILWSRKWLEKFIILYWKDIPKKQNPLNEKIKWLEAEEKIQDHQLLDDLRFISNKGGHIESPTEEIIFTKNDSELCISIIEDLIEEYYVEPFEKHKRKENLHALREATQNEADRIKKTK